MRQVRRVAERLMCDIPVSLSVGGLKRPGRIIDVTPFGARVQMRNPFPDKAPLTLHLRGQEVEALVMWVSADLVGLRFASTVVDGPLRKRIETLNKSAYGDSQLPGMRQLDQSRG